MSGECDDCGEHTFECRCLNEHRGPGRPEAKINWSDVEDRLKAGSPIQEIADSIGISPDTLYRRCSIDNNINFTEYSQRCKAHGIAELRSAQFKKAIGKLPRGDSTMLKHLGEWRLGQKEKKKENDSVQFDKDLIIFLGKVAKDNSELFESLRPYLEDQQLILDQGQSGESCEVQDELGPEGAI